MKRWVVVSVAVAVVALAGAGVWWFALKGKGQQQYRTAQVERGDIVQTVRATGVVQPMKLVQVGTQVNGPVSRLYVDFNDRVKAGDLVAQIDSTVYEAGLARDQATLVQNLATVEQVQAKLSQAEKELSRSKDLAQRDMLSQTDLDSSVADRDTLAAQLKVAQASVEQSKATLRLSKANLDYTTIRSPVNGVVISRNVDEGQTVVASMSAQVLFQVATDLEQIQVLASIPEADVGKVHTNQPVTFTVDAYEQEFRGTVGQIRLAAATVQNVVTYPIIIRAANPDGKLFPGMTANIICEVARQTDVVKVPNAALRFKPAEAQKTADAEKTSAGQGKGAAKGRAGGARRGAKVWVQKAAGAPPEPIRVTPGISDGSSTELTEPVELHAGQDVIVGLAEGGKSDQGTVNPFVPRPPSGSPRPR